VRTKLIIIGLALGVWALAQSSMNNDSVIKMAKAGLGEDVIVGSINGQPGTYKTSADDLIALKGAGVSDKVIGAMIAKSGGGKGAPAAAPAAAAAPASLGPVNEVGVYYKKDNTWTDLNPEVVNFKTGGVLKSIGTAGIVKGDINGHLNGEHSPNALHTPVEILIYTPEGTAATEYQLLRLHDQKDSREFRTMTGGVLHASGGATRDSIPFENKKVAARTYEIIMPASIGPGEYGILPPSSGDGTGSSGRIGKLYSFRVIE
jgi:hypothetical protein